MRSQRQVQSQLIMELHVEKLLRSAALQEGLQSRYRTTVQNNAIGKSFHGIVTSIMLEDDTKKVPVIVKQGHTDALTRNAQKTAEKFKNEAHFYNEMVGRLRRHGHLPRIPKFYGAILAEMEETIVLEDLRAEGFVLTQLSEGLDTAHLNIVAQALALLHETSFIWKTRDPGSFQEVVGSLTETFFVSHENPECQRLAGLLFEHAVKSGLGCVPADLEKRCSDYLMNGMLIKLSEIDDWVSPSEDERSTTILHGDAWCHNFLFKYNSKGDPVEVALIDWQMVRLGSPALDLIESFLSSAQTTALARPTEFVEFYAEIRHVQKASLVSDFPKWGRPGLLLVFSILVNVLTDAESNLATLFDEAVKSDCIKNAPGQETRIRIENVLRSAEQMGLFNSMSIC